MYKTIKCNTPKNIKVFSTSIISLEVVEVDVSKFENINIDIGSYCVIIWEEEREFVTNLNKFPKEQKIRE